MRGFKVAATILCIGILALAFSPGARADQYNHKTFVTFSAPVEIPGVGAQTLPAGTYVIRLVDSQSSRDIVQVLNKDETHVYATILAIPNYRLRATGKTVITFKERAAGAPEALKAWFYPGNIDGQEFVWPRVRAVELAKETNESVLSSSGTVTAAEARNESSSETAVTPSQQHAMMEAPVMATKPSGEEVEMAQVIPPSNLPQTASSLPLIALIGLLSMGGSWLLSLAYKWAA